MAGERVGFVGLGTMGAAMAANLARAGFPLVGLEPDARTCRRAGRARRPRADSPAAAGRADRTSSWSASRTRPTSRPSSSATDGVADGCPQRARSSSTARRSRRRAAWDFAARLARAGRRLRRCPGLGRLRRRPEGHADDLRRRRRGGRRARPTGPRRPGPDHHPRRPDRRRSGGQGRQPGHPRRHVPRRRGGHRPRDQGRPRCRAGRRGARRRGGPELGPREPERPDDRQRLPARVQGRAPSQGSRHRPRAGRRVGREPAGAALAAQIEDGLVAGATATTTCPRSRGRSAACPASGLSDWRAGAEPQWNPTSSIGSPSLPS